MPPKKKWPAPLVIPPLSKKHTHTIISLHGKGSNAKRYGLVLLTAATLRARLPTVKFVFPTAKKRRATRFKRMPINQWFDNFSIVDPGERIELQVDGLCETADFVRDLISEETRILGEGSHKRIILWGLSQGCAAGIFTLLGGSSDTSGASTIGAFVGMSGWLPFEQQLCEILRCGDIQGPASASASASEAVAVSDTQDRDDAQQESSSDDGSDLDTASDADADADASAFSEPDWDDDPFERSCSSHDDFDPFAAQEEEAPLLVHAINHVRDVLDLPLFEAADHSPNETPIPSSCGHLRTPVFIGHGSEDKKVAVELGTKMNHVLSVGLGMDVTWKIYQGLGHWYRVQDEIEDILTFLQDRVDLPVKKLLTQRQRKQVQG
ncbi:Phospholipase/carboxylesterase/thioesterase [Penicillium paradoxum]|uniref:Phospholipase/carboxylesterase/thioesterase n=1 Tax=Penicillium paradoxum TaxID=176176 RepID=UPI00254768CE|nr:Phospholipase/carboxylesterase/thioesterase [Penicillium paradoxum]KAJ5779487.1 Phospholipase/carboxylesterase/thioesterase [Penicillium paradoxum]